MGRDYYHDKGQKDYSAGRYEKPHGLGESLLTWGSSKMKSDRRDNESYEKGYGNAKKQGRRR